MSVLNHVTLNFADLLLTGANGIANAALLFLAVGIIVAFWAVDGLKFLVGVNYLSDKAARGCGAVVLLFIGMLAFGAFAVFVLGVG